jgi:uncharacterized membrane protein YcfT
MNPARKLYLDNIRWMTVVLVVIYHVVYMFNLRLMERMRHMESGE